MWNLKECWHPTQTPRRPGRPSTRPQWGKLARPPEGNAGDLVPGPPSSGSGGALSDSPALRQTSKEPLDWPGTRPLFFLLPSCLWRESLGTAQVIGWKRFKRESWSFQSSSGKRLLTSECGGPPTCSHTSSCHCQPPDLSPPLEPKLYEGHFYCCCLQHPEQRLCPAHIQCNLAVEVPSSTCKNTEDFFLLMY